jgi:GNAT superfamily N-acetyltransferase
VGGILQEELAGAGILDKVNDNIPLSFGGDRPIRHTRRTRANAFSEKSFFMQTKKARYDEVADDIVELDAHEVIKFFFDGSETGISPEFVHQSFGRSGKLVWFKDFMPLSINVYVNTKNGMSSHVEFTHAGDQDSPEASILKFDMLSKMATPCDALMEGCKPAVYPGDLVTGKSKSPSAAVISPSESTTLAEGFTVDQFSASDLSGRSLDAWKRTEWLMLWFIESVSQSQHETDSNWEYYFLRDESGHVLAVSSIYRFPSFNYLAENIIGERLRISQFLTMPHKRGRGYGSILLNHIAKRVLSSQHTDLLTMEDPSPGMNSLRDVVYLNMLKEKVKSSSLVDTSVEAIVSELKVPAIFAKRLKYLLEIFRETRGKPASEEVIARIFESDNPFIRKFIDSIEFYDEEVEGDQPSEEANTILILKALSEALRKIDKTVAMTRK